MFVFFSLNSQNIKSPRNTPMGKWDFLQLLVNMSSTPNLEDQVSGSMDGPTSEDRVHGSLGNLKPPLAEFSKAPPSTAVFNTSTLGASIPLSKDLGSEQNTALSYLLTYVTQGVAQTLKKEIDDSVRKQFNETLVAQTPVKASAPVPGTSDSNNDSPGSVAEIPESLLRLVASSR